MSANSLEYFSLVRDFSFRFILLVIRWWADINTTICSCVRGCHCNFYTKNDVHSKTSWHWTFFEFCYSVEGINGIIEVWIIVGVSTTRSENSTHSTRHAPYQVSNLNRAQGNPGLLHIHTQLYWSSWRIIHVTDMNLYLVPGVFWGVHSRTFGWPIHDFHVLVLQEIICGLGCGGRSIILNQNKVFLEGSSCPERETLPSVSCTHTSMCLSPCRLCTRAHLYDATWILTGEWRYSVASGRCPKHDILPTEVLKSVQGIVPACENGVLIWRPSPPSRSC